MVQLDLQIMQFGMTLHGIISMRNIKRLVKSKQPGLTLIELLLYIAIFSIIITAVATIGITATAQRVRNNAVAEVDYQGEAVMSYITQSVRNAQSLNSPGANNSSQSLSLNTNISANNPTVFDSVGDGSISRIRIREGSPPTDNYLTNNKVTVTDISFTNASVVGGHDSIKIQFTIRYYNPSGRAELNYEKTFYGGVTLR